MARVAGRNTPFAVFVVVVCLAIVGVLLFLALPMFPEAAAWTGSFVDGVVEMVRKSAGG